MALGRRERPRSPQKVWLGLRMDAVGLAVVVSVLTKEQMGKEGQKVLR